MDFNFDEVDGQCYSWGSLF